VCAAGLSSTSGGQDLEVMAGFVPQRRRRAGHRGHRCGTMEMRGVQYVSDLLLTTS
jgi:hypothetical protein